MNFVLFFLATTYDLDPDMAGIKQNFQAQLQRWDRKNPQGKKEEEREESFPSKRCNSLFPKLIHKKRLLILIWPRRQFNRGIFSVMCVNEAKFWNFCPFCTSASTWTHYLSHIFKHAKKGPDLDLGVRNKTNKIVVQPRGVGNFCGPQEVFSCHPLI